MHCVALWYDLFPVHRHHFHSFFVFKCRYFLADLIFYYALSFQPTETNKIGHKNWNNTFDLDLDHWLVVNPVVLLSDLFCFPKTKNHENTNTMLLERNKIWPLNIAVIVADIDRTLQFPRALHMLHMLMLFINNSKGKKIPNINKMVKYQLYGNHQENNRICIHDKKKTKTLNWNAKEVKILCNC